MGVCEAVAFPTPVTACRTQLPPLGHSAGLAGTGETTADAGAAAAAVIVTIEDASGGAASVLTMTEVKCSDVARSGGTMIHASSHVAVETLADPLVSAASTHSMGVAVSDPQGKGE